MIHFILVFMHVNTINRLLVIHVDSHNTRWKWLVLCGGRIRMNSWVEVKWVMWIVMHLKEMRRKWFWFYGLMSPHHDHNNNNQHPHTNHSHTLSFDYVTQQHPLCTPFIGNLVWLRCGRTTTLSSILVTYCTKSNQTNPPTSPSHYVLDD